MKENNEKHSPLPWVLAQNEKDQDYIFFDVTKLNVLLAGVFPKTERSQADAALIVRAVNSHAALVDALQKIAEMGTHYPPFWDEFDETKKQNAINAGFGPIYSEEAKIANFALAGVSKEVE